LSIEAIVINNVSRLCSKTGDDITVKYSRELYFSYVALRGGVMEETNITIGSLVQTFDHVPPCVNRLIYDSQVVPVHLVVRTLERGVEDEHHGDGPLDVGEEV
jgi:hypothetical protein